MKTTAPYWNPLASENESQWEEVEGSEGQAHQMTLAEDLETGDYTRLTRFKNGYSTQSFGVNSHDYPEEIFMVSGRLYDESFGMWLEAGCYASRPPGERHGPFRAEGDVVVLEMSYPSQAVKPDLFSNEI
jgi:hypothetical protein